MLNRCWNVGLGVAVMVAAMCVGPAGAQSLPGVATTDNMVIVALCELEGLEPAAMRAAVQAVAPDALVLVGPKIKRFELLRKRLGEAGVVRLGTAVGMTIGEMGPNELAIVLFELAAGKRPDTTAADVVKAAMGDATAEMHESQLVGNWVVASQKDKMPDLKAKPGEHAEKIQAALKSVGKRPGGAVVFGAPVRGLVEGVADGIGKMAPPSAGEALTAILAADWVSVAAKVDEKPALRITLQLAEDAAAKQFADNWPQVSKELRSFFDKLPQFKGGPDDPPAPPGLQMLALLPGMQAKAQGSQVLLTLGPKGLASLIDIVALGHDRFLVQVAADHGVTMELLALGTWLQIYREVNGKGPKSLDDLKPLLADTKAEQNAIYKKLLTHPVTGEFPAYRYHQPAVDPQPDEDAAAKTLVLEELKAGKPDPEGYREFQDGHTEYKRPKQGD